MRSDYALYVVAVIFFLLTAIAAVMLVEPERPVWVVTTAVLGFLFVGIGYSQRPKLKAVAVEAPSAAPSALPPITEAVEEKKPEALLEAVSPKVELKGVKGIGVKRAEQLKTLGIMSIEDLARSSAKDLAEKLKISPKITGKWIENAKKLAEKP